MTDVTSILSQIESGDQQASNELLPLVYDELRKLAAARMANERADHTLQATALVHEAYVRLVDAEQIRGWDSSGHFFAAAAEGMRRILIESARSKSSDKRGGDLYRAQDFDLGLVTDRTDASWPEQLLEVDAALEQLREEEPQAAELVPRLAKRWKPRSSCRSPVKTTRIGQHPIAAWKLSFEEASATRVKRTNRQPRP